MDSKLLTENGWKMIALKFKVKDNGLQRALAAYEKLDEQAHEERLKTIASVSQLAGTLKKVKEVAAVPEVVKYLANVADTAESQKSEIAKAKALAAKTEAMTQKKADAEAKEREQEEEQEAEEGDYHVKLLAAFQKLKGAKDVAYEFIVCDAKPHCGLMVAKRITPKHKEELTRITGGSKRFLHTGTCQFVDGKFDFRMEQPVSGLARKLQDSIKNFTGKKLPIKVGTESAEAADEQAPGGQASASTASKQAQTATPPKLGQATLEKAPEVWHSTRGILDTNINELKKAIRNEFAGQSPELIAGIETTVSKLDVILDKLDHRLADSLAKAHAAKDPATRQAELKNSKTILADYINYVKNEPLIAHIDSNPFGIQTNLKHVLTDSLTHMAQAIG
jgi:hypothetical protein